MVRAATGKEWNLRGDSGQGTSEYLGIVLVIALIIVAIVASNLDVVIADLLRDTVAGITEAGTTANGD